MIASASVFASVRLPSLAFPALALLPMEDADRRRVHDLPPYEEKPDAFVRVTSRPVIGREVRELCLAVYRTASPGLFRAVA